MATRASEREMPLESQKVVAHAVVLAAPNNNRTRAESSLGTSYRQHAALLTVDAGQHDHGKRDG